MLMLISTLAIVGIGKASTNAKNIIPKSNVFILLPPLFLAETSSRQKEPWISLLSRAATHQVYQNQYRNRNA